LLTRAGVLLFSFVLFRENLFESLRLVLSAPLIRKRRLVTYHELLAATVTPHDAHLFESRRLLATLALLYCHCLHLLNFSD
jgi:hypothetical protein